MTTQETVLHPAAIIEELKKNEFTHVVWLPDSETNFMYQLLTNEPTLDLVPVCREGETMAIAAGLWVGGKKPVVLIQNTGIFESGDSIRGLGLDVNQPLVMLVGYRGWSRHGITNDSAARFIEHILHAWGISYYLIETDDDAGRITSALEEAERTSKPVAVLVGTEFIRLASGQALRQVRLCRDPDGIGARDERHRCLLPFVVSLSNHTLK
jgi:sulfopyruvate decarboxylase TPP-binding subunit